MLIVAFSVISLLCVWMVLRPLLISSNENTASFLLNEMQSSELVDLKRFKESLDFERARGLIAEDEYSKQQIKIQKRIQKISGEDA